MPLILIRVDWLEREQPVRGQLPGDHLLWVCLSFHRRVHCWRTWASVGGWAGKETTIDYPQAVIHLMDRDN